jgi:hypothetical protein
MRKFGFQPDSSTEMASFKLVDEILKSMNKRYATGGIFCDLQKAFDCANHDILLKKKAEFYGITGKFCDLIKSYLKGRFQTVNLGTNNSALFFLRMGRGFGRCASRFCPWTTFFPSVHK